MHALVADIGGTNARFALVAGSDPTPCFVQRLPTAAYAGVAEAIADYLGGVAQAQGGAVSLRAACLAVAGPIEGDRAELTNAAWRFDAAALARTLGCPVRLVNDFQAQAAALGSVTREAVELLGEAAPAPGVRFVLGPGTGLGGAAWLPQGAQGLVVPTEIGHADIAPGDALEIELLNALTARFDRVTWEHVFSGPGLTNLYAAMGELWGMDGAALARVSPEEVLAEALDAQEPMAMHTVEIFANWLGGLAGNLALTFLPRGGLYLTGGIVERIAPVLRRGGFRRRFEARAPLQGLLREMATARILDLDHGLRGAAACMLEPSDA